MTTFGSLALATSLSLRYGHPKHELIDQVGRVQYWGAVAGVVWAHGHVKRPGIHANPSSLLEEFFRGFAGSPRRSAAFLLLLAAECAAGFAAFHLAR